MNWQLRWLMACWWYPASEKVYPTQQLNCTFHITTWFTPTLSTMIFSSLVSIYKNVQALWRVQLQFVLWGSYVTLSNCIPPRGNPYRMIRNRLASLIIKWPFGAQSSKLCRIFMLHRLHKGHTQECCLGNRKRIVWFRAGTGGFQKLRYSVQRFGISILKTRYWISLHQQQILKSKDGNGN